jgi:haloacid dehalogenase-like hydrolase
LLFQMKRKFKSEIGVRLKNRYQCELDKLEDVYRAALALEISDITDLVERISGHPLVAVGSGGSFSTASFAATLHEYRTGQLARAVTPLDVLSSEPRRAGTICFSASGRNRDIGAAFQAAAQAERGPVGALVLSDDTPLHALQSRYTYTDVVGGSGTVFKDGFLAVASMVTSAMVLKRAYDAVFGETRHLPPTLKDFAFQSISKKSFDLISNDCFEAVDRPYLSLLYSTVMSSTAIDLESRFVEAALGPIHTADYRNFGHGRHHWIAKRGEDTGVVALVGSQDSVLATRTLELLPDSVHTWRVDVAGRPDEQAIAGLLIGLYLSAAAGRSEGTDPGKPGVPPFGRKLYRLGPGRARQKTSEVNRTAAIRRKAVDVLSNEPAKLMWEESFARAIKVWSKAKIAGIVFDYDGTLCDPRKRFEHLSDEVAVSLSRILEGGLAIGIATGRGPSAGIALRKCIPEKFWASIVIGYYNGAIITRLDDIRDPLIGECKNLEVLDQLKSHSVLKDCHFRANEAQIALRLPGHLDVEEAISAVNSVLSGHHLNVPVTASSHSVDIQFLRSS